LKKSANSTVRADVDFIWDDVVIGADTDAIDFAHENNFYLLKNRIPHHHSYENLESAWAKKSYELYDKGLCPFTDKIQTVRVDPETKTAKVVTGHGHYIVKYQNLHVFDIDNVAGTTISRELTHYRVVDWFDCKGLHNLTCRQITTNDDFVNKLVFFKTCRIDGDQKYLDLLCESFLSEDQLKNFDYSDTMARFKVKDILQKHLNKKVKMRLWKREVYPVYKCLQKNT
jgi:hypothetical protein